MPMAAVSEQMQQEAMIAPVSGTTKIQVREPPVKEDTLFNAEVITIITKLLHDKHKLGIAIISDKFLRLEQTTPKEIQEKINQFYPKQAKDSKEAEIVKHDERLVREDELEALINRNVLVRRGRNNRIFAKLIDRAVFDEEDNCHSED